MKKQTLTKEIQNSINAISQAIYDKKGFNILALDVRGISSLADFVIIAEGNIDRHVKALSLAIKDTLHDIGMTASYIEGEQTGDWIVIDCCDIAIHLFIPELREKYMLEQLWKEASIIDLTIKIDKKTKEAT